MSKLLGQKSSKQPYTDLIITFVPENMNSQDDDYDDDDDLDDLEAPIVRYYFES